MYRGFFQLSERQGIYATQTRHIELKVITKSSIFLRCSKVFRLPIGYAKGSRSMGTRAAEHVEADATGRFMVSRRQLAPIAHELEEVTSFIQHILHERGMKKMLTQVSNTSWMFNTNHGGDKMPLMGSTATHRNFHITGLPPLCGQRDSIG